MKVTSAFESPAVLRRYVPLYRKVMLVFFVESVRLDWNYIPSLYNCSVKNSVAPREAALTRRGAATVRCRGWFVAGALY